MSTLWIFGDSYGMHLANDKHKTSPWNWTFDIGKRLGCTKYLNSSQMGVSNDWILYQIELQKENIKSTDFVIFISTSMTREWLIEDMPHVSNYYIRNLDSILSKDQAYAIKMYITHLQSSVRPFMNFTNSLSRFHYLTNQYNWNSIVIPGFENAGFPVSHKYNVTGSLFDICYNEFKTEKDHDWFINDFSKYKDRRSGHISKNNHYILSDKLYTTFTEGKSLDLTEGFEEKIISRDNLSFVYNQVCEFDVVNELGNKNFLSSKNVWIPQY